METNKLSHITKEELDKSTPPPKEFIEKCKRAGESLNKTKTIKFTAIIKDGGYETFQITPKCLVK